MLRVADPKAGASRATTVGARARIARPARRVVTALRQRRSITAARCANDVQFPQLLSMPETVTPPVTPRHPVTDRVRHALAVSKRGCDELLPEAEWIAKLARAEGKRCIALAGIVSPELKSGTFNFAMGIVPTITTREQAFREPAGWLFRLAAEAAKGL